MPTYTLKNISPDLFDKIKKSAEINRRSINSQILAILEENLTSTKLDPEQIILAARALREKSAHYHLTDEVLNEAKRAGRK